MSDQSEAFVGIDTSKLRNAIAIAEGGRGGEVRHLGEIDSADAAIRKLVSKLAAKYRSLTFCYEAGPTGYGLYRLIRSLGPACMVAAHSLIPKKPGVRAKTNVATRWKWPGCRVRVNAQLSGSLTSGMRPCEICHGPARRRRSTSPASASRSHR